VTADTVVVRLAEYCIGEDSDCYLLIHGALIIVKLSSDVSPLNVSSTSAVAASIPTYSNTRHTPVSIPTYTRIITTDYTVFTTKQFLLSISVFMVLVCF